jgi:hypothetical protein
MRTIADKRDAEFLQWVADRIVYVYGESPNIDYVLRLREIANRFDEPASTPQGDPDEILKLTLRGV